MSEEETSTSPDVKIIRPETPISKWERTNDPDLFYLHTSMGERSGIYGELYYGRDGKVEIYVHMINVDESERNKGIGTSLLNSFTEEAKDHGALSMFGHVTSESALHLFGKVFGRDKLKFYRYNQLTKERKMLNQSFEQIAEKTISGEPVDYGIGVDLG